MLDLIDMSWIVLCLLAIMCFSDLENKNGSDTIISYDRKSLFSIGKLLKNAENPLLPNGIANIHNLNIKKKRGYNRKTFNRSNDQIGITESTFDQTINHDNLVSLGVQTRITSQRKLPKSSVSNNSIQDNTNLIKIKSNTRKVLNSSSIAVLNARSIKSNCDIIRNFIDSDKPNITFISETWAKESDNEFYFKEITPKGYSYMHKDRENGTGGGIALIVQSDFNPRLVKTSQFTSFESLTASISSSGSTLRLVVVYRPPSSSYQQFCDEFTILLEGLLSSSVPVIIAGDFNVHIDNINNPNTIKFLNILSNFNLSQHVTESTHIDTHWIL